MGDRTQHEGKTERAKESHDRCSQPPGMRMPKTADLGTQALLVVNSFKLHLNSFCFLKYLRNKTQKCKKCNFWPKLPPPPHHPPVQVFDRSQTNATVNSII